jgi:hypothetical protein
MNPDLNDLPRARPGQGLDRRGFLKVGAGFTAALAVASTLGSLSGCGDTPKAPAQGMAFLMDGDLALFNALAPVVVTELASLDAAPRSQRQTALLRNLDATCAALDFHSRAELRKLLDLLAADEVGHQPTLVGRQAHTARGGFGFGCHACAPYFFAAFLSAG